MQRTLDIDTKINRVISLLSAEGLTLRPRKKEDGAVSQLDSFLLYDEQEVEQYLALLNAISGAAQPLFFAEPLKGRKEAYRIVVQLDQITDDMLDAMEKCKQKTLAQLCRFMIFINCPSAVPGSWEVHQQGIYFVPYEKLAASILSSGMLVSEVKEAFFSFMSTTYDVTGNSIFTQLERDIFDKEYMKSSALSSSHIALQLPVSPLYMVFIKLMNHLMPESRYDIAEGRGIDYGNPLGSGAFAVVKAGSYSGKPVALKISIPGQVDSYHSLQRESTIYEWLETAKKKSPHHPGVSCISQYVGRYDQGLNNGFVIVMELANGQLDKLIFGDPKHGVMPAALSPKDAKSIFYGMAAGLSFIHQHDLVYSDIKLENVLYVQDANGIQIKFIDFGLSRHKNITSYRGGSPVYEAPEVWYQHASNAKTDIYGMGILFWEVNARRPVYTDGPKIEDLDTLQEYVSSGGRPLITQTTPAVSSIIERCWAQDANKRPSAAQCADDIKQLDESAFAPKQS